MPLQFKQISSDDLVKGHKYRIESLTSNRLTIYYGVYDGSTSPNLTNWINAYYTYTDLVTLKQIEVNNSKNGLPNLEFTLVTTHGSALTLTKKFFELVKTDIQYLMENRSVNIILKRLMDDSFVY